MKKIVFLLIALLSFAVLYGQGKEEKNSNADINRIILHENRFDKLIDLAKSYMKTNPEFAFNCAYKANDIAKQTNDKKKSAYSRIIIGDIFNENKSYSIAISYYEKAIQELLTIKDYETIYKIYIKIAKLYQNNEFDYKWSIEAMNNAVNNAQMTNNESFIIDANLAYADIFLAQKNYNSALTYYNKILKHKANNNTIEQIAKTISNKAYIYIIKKEYNEALLLIDSSLKISLRNSYNDLIINNYGLKATIFDSLKVVDSAKKYYHKAIELSYSTHNYENCGKFMYDLGMLNKNNNNIKEAIDIFIILSDSTEYYRNYNICYNSYYQLSKCYAILGNYEKAYKFFDKYDIFYTEADKHKNEKKIKDIHTNYLLSANIEELKAKEIETNKAKISKQNMIMFISLGIVLLLMLIIITILSNRNKDLYHKNKEMAYEQQLKLDKMENDLMEIQLRNNKESLINLALHFKSYIEFLNPLKAKLKEIIDSPENETKNKIKNLYVEMQNNNGLFNNTENLYNQINDIYKDFIDRLEQKYPTITKSEKRLCAMLYINMSSKEIAVISNTTIRSVETSRYRLRKKFNLSRDEDMVNFLRTI